MLQKIALGVGLVFATGLVVPEVMAQGTVKESSKGPLFACGSAEDYEKSGQPADLPACAPAATAAAPEALLARAAIERVERHLDAEAAERVTTEMAGARAAVDRLAARGFLQLVPSYRRALSRAAARAALLPDLDGLRSCHTQAQVALRPADEASSPKGAVVPATPQDPRSAQVRLVRADECMAIVRRLLASRTVQEQLNDGLSIEIAPGQARAVGELFADLRAAHRAAQAGQKAAQEQWVVVRGRWLRVLFGDRLRVFNNHPEELPEYEGKARGPLPASALPRWRYRMSDGRIESFLFRKNRLVSRVIEDPRRS